MAKTRQRLNRNELVAALFILFSEEYDRSSADSILDLDLPLSAVRDHLRERFGITYTSDTWIGTQLRKFEEEEGVPLFRKSEGPGGESRLGIAREMRSYSQKRHLYVTQKIKVANAVLDLVTNEGRGASGGSVGILLGAGSTVTRIAEALAELVRPRRSEGRQRAEGERRWLVATHNLGALQALGSSSCRGGMELLVPEGRVDPATYAILGRNEELYRRLELDWSVEGTSFLHAGRLFVESAEEARVKSAILRDCPGRKVLVLTGHEAVESPPAGLEPFGSVSEYDFVVLPRAPLEGRARSRFYLAMEELRAFLEPWVLNWNYEVLRVRRARA
ncbi:MAG TPA: hypothetical protein PLB91_14485 [Spirochaetales bacterium]|nr:hypothetical protein [Spirochaetales bacterium]HRY55658.1 hypothetical protein [Spirochaetia bacterium]HRZ63540.1 hypothetical protein [Spirochaetia bacterium]